MLFKGLKSFRNLFQFHDRENEILNEEVILIVVALIFSPTVLERKLNGDLRRGIKSERNK